MERRRIGNVLWGLFWLALGVMLFGKVFGWWEFNILFPGWWTLLIIVPSVIGIIKHGFGCFSTICFVLGMLMLMSYQVPDIMPRSMVWKLITPTILLVIGANIIIRGIFISTKEAIDRENPFAKPQFAAVFNGINNRLTGPFYGCTIDSNFGGSKIDLRDAQIDRDIVINVTSIFGGTEVYLPSNVKVKVSSVGLFGGTDNKHYTQGELGATVYVSSLCMFGGTDIR